MKNTKELRTILAVLFYLNRLGAKDEDITKLIDYTFRRVFECNTNLLVLACVGKTRETAMPEITKLLEEDTQYLQYLEEYKK